MQVRLPILYAQGDSRWGKEKIGFDTGEKEDLANFGCVLTCLAMICRYYRQEETPATINQKLREVSGFVHNDLYLSGALTKIHKEIKERSVPTPALLTDGQVGEIRSALESGYPVIVGLDFNPRTVAYDSHFVLLVDSDAGDENNFTIADPLTGTLHSLKDYLGWFRPTARRTIESYAIFSGTVTPASSLPANYPQIIFKSTQWDIACEKLELGQPETTPYEVLDRVVRGYKSRETDWSNTLERVNKELAVSQQEIKNREEQVSRLNTQLLDQRQLYHKLQTDVAQIDRLWEGKYQELWGKYELVAKEKGMLANELVACQKVTPVCSSRYSFLHDCLERLLAILKRKKEEGVRK